MFYCFECFLHKDMHCWPMATINLTDHKLIIAASVDHLEIISAKLFRNLIIYFRAEI